MPPPTSGFNEAPIHESGKLGKTLSDAAILMLRFNEAPIHESGKCYSPQRPTACPRASMRPRFMNRGSATISPPKSNRSLGFNEAPIHESGKSRCGICSRIRILRFNEAPIHESGKFE